jgi:hypothetical protein
VGSNFEGTIEVSHGTTFMMELIQAYNKARDEATIPPSLA